MDVTVVLTILYGLYFVWIILHEISIGECLVDQKLPTNDI